MSVLEILSAYKVLSFYNNATNSRTFRKRTARKHRRWLAKRGPYRGA
jgi:hypothetical protein